MPARFRRYARTGRSALLLLAGRLLAAPLASGSEGPPCGDLDLGSAVIEDERGLVVFPVGEVRVPSAASPEGELTYPDIAHIQCAVDHARGGTVLLEAYGRPGTPQAEVDAFEFGRPNSREDLWDHLVVIGHGVDLRGEIVDGHRTTIRNGNHSLVVGREVFDDAGAYVRTELDGDVTIEGLHLAGTAASPIHVGAVSEGHRVLIRNNLITTALWDDLSEVAGTGGLGLRNVPQRDEQGRTTAADHPCLAELETNRAACAPFVQGPAPDEPAAAPAWGRLFFLGGFPSGRVVNQWVGWGITASGPYLRGAVVVEGNTIDFDADSTGLPDRSPARPGVWWHTFGVLFARGFTGEVVARGNVVRGATVGGIGCMDPGPGSRCLLEANTVEAGLASYHVDHWGLDVAARGLGAYTGVSVAPETETGGRVIVTGNTVRMGRDGSGVSITGMSDRVFDWVEVVDNTLLLDAATVGIHVRDTPDARIEDNRFVGSASLGLDLGFVDEAEQTRDTIAGRMLHNDMTRLTAETYVVLQADTRGSHLLDLAVPEGTDPATRVVDRGVDNLVDP